MRLPLLLHLFSSSRELLGNGRSPRVIWGSENRPTCRTSLTWCTALRWYYYSFNLNEEINPHKNNIEESASYKKKLAEKFLPGCEKTAALWKPSHQWNIMSLVNFRRQASDVLDQHKVSTNLCPQINRLASELLQTTSGPLFCSLIHNSLYVYFWHSSRSLNSLGTIRKQRSSTYRTWRI